MRSWMPLIDSVSRERVTYISQGSGQVCLFADMNLDTMGYESMSGGDVRKLRHHGVVKHGEEARTTGHW